MSKQTYHETASHYSEMLSNIDHEILGQIVTAIQWLGGKVCLGYYHNEKDFDQYTFYECDDDGYGRELYVDSVSATVSGELIIHLSDTEDCYCPIWDETNLTTTDAINLLRELESVIKHVQSTNEKVVTEYPLNS